MGRQRQATRQSRDKNAGKSQENKMSTVRAIDRAGTLLFAIYEAGRPMSLTELADVTGLRKTTVHRILGSLSSLRFVIHDIERKTYRLGLGLVDLGHAAVTSIDLRGVARRHLKELAERIAQTVHLAVLDGDFVAYIDKIESPNQEIMLSSWIGKRVPLNTTSLGKVFLSGNTDAGLRQVLDRIQLVKSTSNSIIDSEILFDVCSEVRESGYAIDDGEQNEFVKCAAAPILNSRGEIVAAVSASTVGIDIESDLFKEHIKSVVRTALTISQEIGFRVLTK